MAEMALTTYEITASWAKAFENATEFAADEWGIRATKAQSATALVLAKTGWEGIRASVKKAICLEA